MILVILIMCIYVALKVLPCVCIFRGFIFLEKVTSQLGRWQEKFGFKRTSCIEESNQEQG